jgi:hypothetical protein
MLALSLLADAASEGKDVITVMLVVGLVFIAVILLGDGLHWLKRRRHG